MTSSAPTPTNPRNANTQDGAFPEGTSAGTNTSNKTLGVAAIGYAFMGKAHSNAWRNVASFFDVPAFEQKVLVGRDPEQVAEAAAKYGWSESATDWRTVLERDDI